MKYFVWLDTTCTHHGAWVWYILHWHAKLSNTSCDWVLSWSLETFPWSSPALQGGYLSVNVYTQLTYVAMVHVFEGVIRWELGKQVNKMVENSPECLV